MENQNIKACFATVIYKQARPFFEQYIESVMAQEDQDFDLLLLNDNYSSHELATLPITENTILVDASEKSLSIGLLRVELIREAKKRGYDLMIIGDADDTFVNTRIGNIKRAYELDKSYAFYYNELVTDKGNLVFDYVPEIIRNVRPISQGNFLGMSTTAINLNQLSMDYIDSLEKGDCNIFDWYLYSRILMDIGPGKMVEAAETVYRIHENNEVGVTHDVNREYQVKLEHYSRLRQYSYFQKMKWLYENTDIYELDTTTSNHNFWWSNIYMEENYEI